MNPSLPGSAGSPSSGSRPVRARRRWPAASSAGQWLASRSGAAGGKGRLHSLYSTHLLALINNILDLSQVEAGNQFTAQGTITLAISRETVDGAVWVTLDGRLCVY